MSSDSVVMSPGNRSIRHLWKVRIAAIGLDGTEKDRAEELTWNIVNSESLNKKVVLKQARSRLSAEWWDEHTVVSIQYSGQVVMIDGVGLWEE